MKIPSLLIFLLCICLTSSGQTWQWGIRGGGSSNGLNVIPEESVVDMATDLNGNLYTLSIIEASGNPTLANTTLAKWGNRDILLSSFTCNGVIRWKKVIGTPADDRPTALTVDTFGNVYATGNHWMDVHVDTDSTFANNNFKKVFIVKYDTAGDFKWIRHPSSDTSSPTMNITYTRVYDVVPDGAGNAGILCYMRPQLLAGGTHVIPSAGYYHIAYDGQGNISNVIPLQMTGFAFFSSFRALRTRTGRFVLCGTVNLSASEEALYIAGQQVNNPMFVICFDANGQLLWKKQNTATNSFSGFSHRPALDANGDIYLSGSTYTPDAFNGHTFTNPFGASTLPFVVKLDSTGNNVWLKQSFTDAATMGKGLALANNKVFTIGDYPATVLWGAHQYTNAPNTNYDIFFTTLDAQTGNVLAIDSLQSDFGVYDFSGSVTADKFGNVYVGGGFGSQLPVGSTTLVNSGGDSDFFIARYGSANCNTVLPVSLTSFMATQRPQYVRCGWQTASEQNTSHFILERSTNGQQFSYLDKIIAAGNSNIARSYDYNDEDAYKQLSSKLYYRLRMVDKDGSYSYSNVVAVQLTSAGSFVMAPNPSMDITKISYRFPAAANATNSLSVYNTSGVEVFNGRLNNEGTFTLNLASHPPGIYLVQLRQDGTTIQTAKLVISR